MVNGNAKTRLDLLLAKLEENVCDIQVGENRWYDWEDVRWDDMEVYLRSRLVEYGFTPTDDLVNLLSEWGYDMYHSEYSSESPGSRSSHRSEMRKTKKKMVELVTRK